MATAFTRTLRYKSTGAAVQSVKERLRDLDCFDPPVKEFKRPDFFGKDTERAVVKFQKKTFLDQKDWDGVVGPKTWAALFGSAEPQEPVVVEPSGTDYSLMVRFSRKIRDAVIPALEGTTQLRRDICLAAIRLAIDPFNPPEYPLAFYIRGANLYDDDGDLHVMTEARLRSYFSKADWAQYYSGARMDMMWEAARASGFTIPGADCSGLIVGLMILFQIYDNDKIVGNDNRFDANANKLYSVYCTPVDDPKPGDWAWKDGHIGLYVGGGYIVEFVGGEYGCQITVAKDRRVYSFIDHKVHRFSKWQGFGDPSKY